MSTVFNDFVIMCEDGRVTTSPLVIGSLSKRLKEIVLKLESVNSDTLVLPRASVAEV